MHKSLKKCVVEPDEAYVIRLKYQVYPLQHIPQFLNHFQTIQKKMLL